MRDASGGWCRYPGGLKERTVQDQLDRNPTEVIRHAVSRMIPKNKLRDVSALSPCALVFCQAVTMEVSLCNGQLFLWLIRQ